MIDCQSMPIDLKELQRKLIHLSSMWIVFSLHYLEFSIFIKILHLTSFVVISLDWLRHRNKFITNISKTLFGFVLRDHELVRGKLTGASFMMIAACIVCDFFSLITASFAMSVLIICDSFAAIIGKHFGKNKIADKTLEGCFGFVISGFAIGLFMFYKFELSYYWLVASFSAVIVGALIELYSNKLKIDDNLSIPIAVAITMKLIFNQ
jgi:dolichol kinase